jgi:hypothetical protein
MSNENSKIGLGVFLGPFFMTSVTLEPDDQRSDNRHSNI